MVSLASYAVLGAPNAAELRAHAMHQYEQGETFDLVALGALARTKVKIYYSKTPCGAALLKFSRSNFIMIPNLYKIEVNAASSRFRYGNTKIIRTGIPTQNQVQSNSR